MLIWQTPAVIKTTKEAWTQVCSVQALHLIHPVQVLWVLADSTLGRSLQYQGVRLFCSQENINIQEIWGYIIALFTVM